MAARREVEAAKLSEDEIWVSIISKFALLELPIENRIEMMLQAMNDDKSLIQHYLKLCVRQNLIGETLMTEVLSQL